MRKRVRIALFFLLLTAFALARIILFGGKPEASPHPRVVLPVAHGAQSQTGENTQESTPGGGNNDSTTRFENTTRSPEAVPNVTAAAATAVVADGKGDGDGDRDRDDRGSGVSDRVYLNDLVTETVGGTNEQLTSIAFLKTHKTGSTTLASILYRYALRHGVKLANFGSTRTVVSIDEAIEMTRQRNETLDVMHYHLTSKGRLQTSWREAANGYRKIMRDPENIYWLTVIREPREHLLSYYYYFREPETKVPIEAFLQNGGLRRELIKNTLASEFGVNTEAEALDFVKNYLPSFSLIILSERMDEGLMMLRRDLGWRMVDMTYTALLKTKAGETRGWDGRALKDRPRFSDLPKKAQDTIDGLTVLDRVLYDAAREEFDKRLGRLSDEIEDDLRAFAELQDVCNRYLDANSSSEANSMYRGVNPYQQDLQLRPF